MSKVQHIRYLGKQTVYNVEVEKTHNFITSLGTILHNCRYFIISRNMASEAERKAKELNGIDDIEETESYEEFMTGGNATSSYINF